MNRLRTLLPIAMRMARHRIGALAALWFAVVGGIALVTPAGVLAQTGITSEVPADWLAETDIVVSASQYVAQDEDLDVPLSRRVPVDAQVIEDLAGVSGVGEVGGRVGFPAALVGTDSEGSSEAGSNWTFATLGAPKMTGQAPTTDGEIALSRGTARQAGVSIGEELEIAVAGEVTTYRVTAIVDAPGTGIYFTDAFAARHYGRDDVVDVIGVMLAPGADPTATAEAVGTALAGTDLVVSNGADRGDVAHFEAASARGMLIAIAMSLAGVLVMTIGFIVAAAVAISVNQQRPEIALLRATGATSRQVRWLIAAQVTLVALLAVPVGLPAGYLLAHTMAGAFTDFGLLPAILPVATSPIPGVGAALLIVVAVHIATRLAAMRISRMAPTEAVAESRIEPRQPAPWRTGVGCALIALSFVTSLSPLFTRSEAGFATAASGVLVAIIGLALVGPAAVRAVTGRRVAKAARFGAPKWLAVHNAHGYALRTAGVITVLALSIALAVVQIFTTTTLGAAVTADVANGAKMSATVTGTTGVSESARESLSTEEGVASAVGTMQAVMVWPYESDGGARADEVPTTAFSSPPGDVVDLSIVDGDINALVGDAFAMEAQLAWFEGVSLGDRVELITDDGTVVTPRLVATYERGFGFGTVVTTTELLAGHSPNRLYDTVLAVGDPSVIQEWAADLPLALTVSSRDDQLAAGGVSPDRWVSMAVTMVLLGYLILSGANNLIATTARRRGELALLRLLGATPSQVRSMMRDETRRVCLMAAVAGLALSVPSMTILGIGMVGLPWPQGPLWVIPLLVGIVCAVAYPAIMIPAERALRSSPLEALPEG